MFHYVDPNEEIQQKKRAIQYLIKVNKTDRGLGLTKPEAEKVDDLLKACEDIETQGNIVLKSLSQSLLRSSQVPQDSIQRFYVVIRKGLFTLSHATFKQTPRTDIQNITDYRDSLYKMKTALDETFNLLNEEMYGNEPLRGRSVKEYEAQTGIPYRPTVPAKVLSDSINKTIDKEKLRARYVSDILRLEETLREYQGQFASIDDRIQQTRELIQVKRFQQEEHTLQNKNAMREYEFQSDAEQKRRDARMEAISKNYAIAQRFIDEYMNSLEQLEAEKQSLPNTIRNVNLQIETVQNMIDKLPEGNTEPLSNLEYANQKYYEDLASFVDIDFNLVMKELNKFLNSLTDGITRYESGVSTSLSRSQVTNYRTPTENAILKLGSGIPKRFL